MSIRHRFLLGMIALSAISVSLASWFAHRDGETSLQEAVIRQLTGIRRSRAYQIESYFQTLQEQVQSLSDDRQFIEAMGQFNAAYEQLNAPPGVVSSHSRLERYYMDVYLPEVKTFMALRKSPPEYLPTNDAAYFLQNRYVVPDTPGDRQSKTPAAATGYERVHSRYDPLCRTLIRRFAYGDLLLIEPRNLRIIYSVAKNPDFGTSLKSGPYRDTPLSRVAEKSVSTADKDAVFLTDFRRYEPLKGAPAAYISSPIFDETTRLGVFALQISSAEIDRVVSGNRGWEKDGLGNTGDLELVGADHLMRSTSRAFLEDPKAVLESLRKRGYGEERLRRLHAYGTTILQTSVSFSAIDKGLQGQEGTTVEPDSTGRPTIVSYMPLKLPGVKWVLLARMDLEEALAPVNAFRRNAIVVTLVVLLITVAMALLMSEGLLSPIRALLSAAQRMTGGDLTARVEVNSRDELGVLSAAFNTMADSVRQSIETIGQKNRENENLLLNILPGPIAERLKSGETTIADSHAHVTVLFADIVGFTRLSASREPGEIVSLLNGLFTKFDATAKKHGIEKIKTIGDAYMAVSGLSGSCPDHAKRMVETALDMLDVVQSYSSESGLPVAIRIGINSGPVAAGVVGTTKFIYDLWGDTVNMASRLESTGIPGAIQVSSTIYEQVNTEYPFEARGAIDIKGKGSCETWLLHLRPVGIIQPSTVLTVS